MNEMDVLIVMWLIVLFATGFTLGHMVGDGADYVKPEVSAEEAILEAEMAGYVQCDVKRIYNDKVVMNCLTDSDVLADQRKVVVGQKDTPEIAIVS